MTAGVEGGAAAGGSPELETVRRAYAAFARRDLEGVLAALDDNVEWRHPGPAEVVPFAGVRTGREAVRQFFLTLLETVDLYEFQPWEFVSQGERVIALGFSRLRVRATGREVAQEWAAVFSVREGRITQFRLYQDTAELVEGFRPGTLDLPASDRSGFGERREI